MSCLTPQQGVADASNVRLNTSPSTRASRSPSHLRFLLRDRIPALPQLGALGDRQAPHRGRTPPRLRISAPPRGSRSCSLAPDRHSFSGVQLHRPPEPPAPVPDVADTGPALPRLFLYIMQFKLAQPIDASLRRQYDLVHQDDASLRPLADRPALERSPLPLPPTVLESPTPPVSIAPRLAPAVPWSPVLEPPGQSSMRDDTSDSGNWSSRLFRYYRSPSGSYRICSPRR